MIAGAGENVILDIGSAKDAVIEKCAGVLKFEVFLWFEHGIAVQVGTVDCIFSGMKESAQRRDSVRIDRGIRVWQVKGPMS